MQHKPAGRERINGGFDQHHGPAAVQVAVRPVGDPEAAEFSAQGLDQTFEAGFSAVPTSSAPVVITEFRLTHVVQDIDNTASSYELCWVIQLSFQQFYVI